jgi:hypothetical protein
MFLFQAEERAIKLRKIEENRNLTVQTNHDDNEKPQSLSTTILSQVRYLVLFFRIYLLFFFLVIFIQKHKSSCN